MHPKLDFRIKVGQFTCMEQITNAISTTKSISVSIRWFSVLAERRGCREETLSLPAGTTGAELITLLARETPVISEFRPHLRLAVNQEYVPADTILREGDEVALITPVSGG